MALPTRTVKVKFDGTAKGLLAAGKQGEKAMKDFQDQANRMAAVEIGGGLVDALGALPSQLKGAMIVVGAGLGATMAPALASAIISGILLAVGGGALAAGIIGAARHPRVQAAWKKFANQAGKTFDRFSAPFVSPMVRAADAFRSALRRAEPTIVAIGRTLAPVVDKLAPAVAAMAEKALPGILAAAQASVPLFDALATHAPLLGVAVSQLLQAVAAGGPGATLFFSGLLSWVEKLLPKLGGVLVWLSDLGVKMDKTANGPELAGLKSALNDLKDNTLAGIKTVLESIKTSLTANSETWKKLGKDVEGAIRLIGPAVKWVADQVALNINASITGFAAFYEAVRKVWDILVKLKNILRELFGGSSSLPGNLGNVQFGKIPGKKGGGGVQPFHDYLVGEEGPEILRMGSAGGTVIPNNKITTVGDGSAAPIIVENHIEIGGEVVRVVRTEIREHNRSVRRGVAMAGAR